MRSVIDKKVISEDLIDPFVIQNFLDENSINRLVDYYNNSTNVVRKNTGPITVDINPSAFEEDYFKIIIEKIKNHLARDFKIYSAFFFYTDIPHIIHNDDSFDSPLVYRAITIPLKIFPSINYTGQYPNLCFFDQYYLEGPAKFFNASENIPTYYNKCIYDYSDVQNKNYNGIDENVKSKYLSHLNDKWLEGLSVKSVLDWVPGNALIFNNCRLHCASNFKDIGIAAKLGISIFTCTD